MNKIKGRRDTSKLKLTVKNISNLTKKINGIMEKEKEHKKDRRIIYRLENSLYLSPEIIRKLQNGNIYEFMSENKQSELSPLESELYRIKTVASLRGYKPKDLDETREMADLIKYALTEKLSCHNNKKVKEEIDYITSRINDIINSMYTIIEENNNPDVCCTLLLNKLSELTSVIEENKSSLGSNFSYLKSAVDDYYGKNIRRRDFVTKGVALGMAATVAGGVGYAMYNTVEDSKVADVESALSYLDQDGLKEKYIDENGRVKDGAKEELKDKMLKKLFEDKINAYLGENTKIKVTDVSYGVYTEGNRYQKTTDGYTVVFEDESEKKYYISADDIKCLDQHDGSDFGTVKNKKAKEGRKWLEGSSIEDIIKASDYNERFDSLFKEGILKGANEVLVYNNDNKNMEDLDDPEL